VAAEELAAIRAEIGAEAFAAGHWQQAHDLPLWWAEYYVEPADGNDERDGWTEAHRVAVQATGMIALVEGGADSGFYWNPEDEKGGDCPGCLWSTTDSGDGGQPLPMYDLVSRFGKAFPPGTTYETVSVAKDDVPGVRVLASDRTVLVVNTLDRAISAQVDGKRFDMKAYEVESVSASLLNSNTVADDPRITKLLSDEHAEVVAYVNQVVGSATETLTTVDARYQDAPIIDLITRVQEDVVKAALAGTEYAALPVIAQASPFSRTSEIPAGDVTIRDLSSLYVYDNTLVAKLMTGAQVRSYLEYSAEYFVQTAADAVVDVEKLTNANSRPDYNYDYVSGLRYEIDIAQAAGSRIKNLTYDGAALDDTRQFVLAVNNYRANGGGAFPYVASAKELWSESTEIRTRIAEWVTAKGVLDPKDFASVDWRPTTATP
ncbi:5'-nucleotidase C-terminal domain-containing protein, partial [Streptomyces sp. NPDC005921]